MKHVKSALIVVCLAWSCSGCATLLDSLVQGENAKPCAGLPDAARQSCFHQRGVTSIAYEPPPKKID
jgi:hypothetical protein